MEEELKSIYFDFNGSEIEVPKMCCNNLKKFEKYVLAKDENCDEEMYYIKGVNELNKNYDEFCNIEALKDFLDIGEYVYRIKKQEKYTSFSKIFIKYKDKITKKIISWCEKYGLLYGQGINHDKTKVYIQTFLFYSINLYSKFEVWAYISMPEYDEKEKLGYANKILKKDFDEPFELLEEVRETIFPQDIKNDVINSEIYFFPVNYKHIFSCQAITNVLELQFLFLCTSEEGIVNADMQYVKILECRNCKNLYATFNARTKYCKYCNDKTTRALARQQKHRNKNKKEL